MEERANSSQRKNRFSAVKDPRIPLRLKGKKRRKRIARVVSSSRRSENLLTEPLTRDMAGFHGSSNNSCSYQWKIAVREIAGKQRNSGR